MIDEPIDSITGSAGNGNIPSATLADTLGGRQPMLAERVSETIRDRVSGYRLLPRAGLNAQVELAVEQLLRSVRRGSSPVDGVEFAKLAEIGEMHARHGLPVGELLRAWRIGVEAIVSGAREVAPELNAGDGQVSEFVQSVLAWSDAAMIATVGAHRRTERELTSTADQDLTRFVRGTLWGSIPTVELRIHAQMYGLDPAGEYCAFRAQLDEGVSHARLERALGVWCPTRGRQGLCAVVDGDLAGVLLKPPPNNVDAVVGYGPPRPLERTVESYRLAARALATAKACDLRGAQDIATLGLRSAVAMDADLGELLRRRYLEPLRTGGSADDLIATLRAYLACGMHVESTATRLFVHQNTVRYRIARFEELIGVSLRDTEVLIELWWALELSAMRPSIPPTPDGKPLAMRT